MDPEASKEVVVLLANNGLVLVASLVWFGVLSQLQAWSWFFPFRSWALLSLLVMWNFSHEALVSS